VPDAPSSITGFFLYEPPDFESEIDIEIFNDPSGKILFTTYAGGEQTHTETKELPFDPTKDFHDYALFYDRDSITFYVDGEPIQEYEGGLPERRMKLYVNSWFPKWLDGEKPNSDRYVYVDWIEQ
jgi:beta-glucanase (GH16 family)